jgi:hypothetical protein
MSSSSEQVEGKSKDTHVEVSIYNEDDGATSPFKEELNNKLSKPIDAFYRELGRPRRDDDRLRCDANGEDVFQFEDETFEKYLADGHCPALSWTFVSGTGGARC